jgi:hypothetical protein
MGILQQREGRTAVIALRVPSSLKAQFQVLRKRAEDAGFDLSATILDALTRLAKQARDELDRMRDEEHEINGRAMDSTTEKLQ